MKRDRVQAARIVLPCSDLDATLSFFIERLGFRVDAIYPADNPAVAVISGHGLGIELRRGGGGSPGVIRLLCRDPLAIADGATELKAPNGTRIEIGDADPPLVLPPLQSSFVLSKNVEGALWETGRAGMRYRDLIPGRQSGSFIASHIRIPEGGPVPDYVHFHKIHFQMIYCYRGWIRVVYEDQGPPFVLQAGDCVLQPPRIRHRVLESSPGLEVIEIGCPAEHETYADHALTLPTSTVESQRNFDGQRFVCHEAAASPWQPWRLEGFECRDTGIAAATDGLAGARVARLHGVPKPQLCHHNAGLLFTFVLEGALTLAGEGRDAQRLTAGDAFVLPPAMQHAFGECSAELELLEVAFPAAFETNCQ